MAFLRFGVAMAAFSVVGPLQVFNAALGMRRLRQQA
jgi:small neutral amino acid transporter SnatA (MarC family)